MKNYAHLSLVFCTQQEAHLDYAFCGKQEGHLDYAVCDKHYTGIWLSQSMPVILHFLFFKFFFFLYIYKVSKKECPGYKF